MEVKMYSLRDIPKEELIRELVTREGIKYVSVKKTDTYEIILNGKKLQDVRVEGQSAYMLFDTNYRPYTIDYSLIKNRDMKYMAYDEIGNPILVTKEEHIKISNALGHKVTYEDEPNISYPLEIDNE